MPARRCRAGGSPWKSRGPDMSGPYRAEIPGQASMAGFALIRPCGATFPRGGRQAHSKSQLISSASLPNSSRVRVLSAVNRASSSCTRGILCAGMPMRASSFFVTAAFSPCVPAVTRPAGQCPKSALPFCIPPAVFFIITGGAGKSQKNHRARAAFIVP